MRAPYYEDLTTTLYLGDCRVVMAEMAESSVDAIVTDPPYGLEFMGKEWDKLAGDWRLPKDGKEGIPGISGKTWFGAGGAKPRYHAGLSAQEWHKTWAVEALRVLKPGGHALVFGGTRTHHRLMCALEDAGFEVRDCLMYLFGTGFPKGLNVVNYLREEVEKCLLSANVPHVVQRSEFFCLKSEEVKEPIAAALALIRPGDAEALLMEIGRADGSSVVMAISRSDAPMVTIALNTMSSWKASSNGDCSRTSTSIMGITNEMTTDLKTLSCLIGLLTQETFTPQSGIQVNGSWYSACLAVNGLSVGSLSLSTIPGAFVPVLASGPGLGTLSVWRGWNVALKPSYEPIILVRKPLSEPTVAQNVLRWSVGGLNIGACRIPGSKPLLHPIESDRRANPILHTKSRTSSGELSTEGRWPANLLLDEGAAQLLDEQAGERKGGSFRITDGSGTLNAWRRMEGRTDHPDGSRRELIRNYGDSGPVSRFFYTSKASRSEREYGLGGTGIKADHPTCKPLDLMRWLCRLITPPNGVVLDPFIGSGTTRLACILEGFECIGIDQDQHYLDIAANRMVDPRDAQKNAQ